MTALHVYRRAASLSIDERKAWFAAATTNYCKNPSFEVNVTDDWTLGGAAGYGTIARDGTYSVVGSYSGKVTAGSANTKITNVAGVSVPSGAAVAISGRALCGADPGGTKAGLQAVVIAPPSAKLILQATSASNGAWERLAGSWVNDTGAAVTIGLVCFSWFNDSATNVWFDGCQLELQVAATPYCDGSLGTGYSWAGTAHNSTSSRTQLGSGLHAYKRRVAMSADERE